jgi:hypothetical protein
MRWEGARLEGGGLCVQRGRWCCRRDEGRRRWVRVGNCLTGGCSRSGLATAFVHIMSNVFDSLRLVEIGERWLRRRWERILLGCKHLGVSVSLLADAVGTSRDMISFGKKGSMSKIETDQDEGVVMVARETFLAAEFRLIFTEGIVCNRTKPGVHSLGVLTKY